MSDIFDSARSAEHRDQLQAALEMKTRARMRTLQPPCGLSAASRCWTAPSTATLAAPTQPFSCATSSSPYATPSRSLEQARTDRSETSLCFEIPPPASAEPTQRNRNSSQFYPDHTIISIKREGSVPKRHHEHRGGPPTCVTAPKDAPLSPHMASNTATHQQWPPSSSAIA